MTIPDKSKSRTFALTVLAIMLMAGLPSDAQSSSSDFILIVNDSSDIEELPTDSVSRIFLGKLTRWNNGSKIVPIEPPASSDVRSKFSTTIHGRSVGAIRNYWRTLIYAGRSIPPREDSCVAILNTVRENPNAIGYVSVDMPLGRGVKKISISE